MVFLNRTYIYFFDEFSLTFEICLLMTDLYNLYFKAYDIFHVVYTKIPFFLNRQTARGWDKLNS